MIPRSRILPTVTPSEARSRRRWCRSLPICLLLISAIAGVSEAQTGLTENDQYTVDSTSITNLTIPEKTEFEEAIDDSRLNLGPVRLRPWAGLRDARYVTNQSLEANDTEEETDFTITVGAGLRAYLRSGKVIWAAHALPEYSWWQDLDDKSQVNGRYGFGVFGYFNRLTFELSRRQVEAQQFFSPEIEVLTSVKSEVTQFSVEVKVARNLYVFGGVQEIDFSGNEEDDAIFTLLDRTEDRSHAGIRWVNPNGLEIGLGYLDASLDSADLARDLSSEETGVSLEIEYDSTRWELLTRVFEREVTPTGNSELAPFDGTTGEFQLLWKLNSRFGIEPYATRDRTLSIDATTSDFLRDRQGVRLRFLTRRGSLLLAAATGEDEYRSTRVGTPIRFDDVQELSAILQVAVGRVLAVTASARYIDYDSNIGQFDRDITSFGLNVDLSRVAERLRIGGGADSRW